MGVKVEDRNYTPQLLRALDELQSKAVEVGIFGDEDSEILMIARVHEYGCRIEVTPKMRAWFAYQGYPLNKDTTQINIPERSFLRSGYDENKKDIQSLVDDMLKDVIALRITPQAFFDAIGNEVAGIIKEYLTELREPPNSPMTVERKNSSNPLIDEERLRGSITYRVVKA